MNDTPVPQANLSILRKAVELAAKEATEAEKALQEAGEHKRAINRIPKGKAGSGKEAKRGAKKGYEQARDDLKQKAFRFEKAQADLKSAEQLLEDMSFMQATTCGDDLGPLPRDQDTQPPLHLDEMLPNPTASECPSSGPDKQENELGKAEVGVQRQEPQMRCVVTSECLSGMLPNPTVCEASDERGNDLGKAEVNAERQEPQMAEGDRVTPECSLSGDQGSAIPFDDLGEADLHAKGPEKKLSVSKSEGVSKKRSRDDTETLNGPNLRKRALSTATRGSRSTSSKKPESESRGTESNDAENFRPVSEDEWVTFLSDSPSDTDVETEKERVAEGKKSKHINLNEEEKRMYRFMEPDVKKAYEKKARAAINQYLSAGKDIDASICRMARLDPTFLPEAATTSRDLALYFLTSKEGNIMCGYHSFKNKASYVRDGWGKPGMKVRGVPGKRKVVTSGRKTKKPDPKGMGNCGCKVQDILLEFALSKLISISGFVDGERRSEMMSFADYMEPRQRLFTFQAIHLMVPNLSLDDFYTHGEAMKHNLRVAKKRVDYWLKSLKDRSHGVATQEECIEDCGLDKAMDM